MTKKREYQGPLLGCDAEVVKRIRRSTNSIRALGEAATSRRDANLTQISDKGMILSLFYSLRHSGL